MKKSISCGRAGVLAISLLLSAFSLAFSVTASAGIDITASTPGNCYLYGSTETCYGTMAGIRNQTADYARDARFGYNSAGTAYFSMIFNGTSYFCIAPPSLNDVIKTAMTSSGYFAVQYNVSTGVCTYLALEAGSSDKNPNNL